MTTIVLFGILSSFLYFKFGFTPVEILSDVNVLRQGSSIASVEYQSNGLSSIKLATNNAVPNLIVGDDESGYKFNSAFLVKMKNDMILNAGAVKTLLNAIIDENDVVLKTETSVINLSDYHMCVNEIEFENVSDFITTISIEFSLNLKTLKDNLPLFEKWAYPILPNNVSMSSRFKLEKTDYNFGYTVTSESFTINNLNATESNRVYKLLSLFMRTGELNDFNKIIGTFFADQLIGYKSNVGFAYSLYNKVTPTNGAIGFQFEDVNGENCFVIKCG